MAANIISTAFPMLGGGNASAGVGGVWQLTLTGTWITNETFAIILTNVTTGQSITLGAGTLTGQTVGFGLTYKNKLNVLFGNTWAFSAVGQPTQFNDLAAVGNGFVTLTDAYSESDTAQAIAPYQGKLAVFGQNNIQIWQVDADPNNYQLVQVLENVGTFAKLSARAFGELDVFFLHRTGVRSLRVRDASNNAYMTDIGSPIDTLIQTQLAAGSATERGAACSIIEPTDSQYWLFLKDTIYVLSYFPTSKITAWSSFLPTYQNSAVAASPNHFTNNSTAKIIRLGYVNDATKYFIEIAAPGSVTTDGLPPANYMWVYSTLGVLTASYTIPTGMLFQGTFSLDAAGTVVTSSNAQTTFTPQKFVTYNGLVIGRSAEGYYVYGGATGVVYDNAICAWETSWLDAETPANEKQVAGMDAAQTGTWSYWGSIDYLVGNTQMILDAEANPTFDGGKIAWTMAGTHMKIRGQTTGSAAKQLVSNLLFHYKITPQK